VTGKGRSILHHLDGRVDGATVAVAQHHDQRNAEHHRAVFETCEAILIDEVARDAHHEQLARALIEGELGRKAGIRAAHDAGERILRLRAGDASSRVVPVGRRIAGVAGVALLQARECLSCARGQFAMGLFLCAPDAHVATRSETAWLRAAARWTASRCAAPQSEGATQDDSDRLTVSTRSNRSIAGRAGNGARSQSSSAAVRANYLLGA